MFNLRKLSMALLVLVVTAQLSMAQQSDSFGTQVVYAQNCSCLTCAAKITTSGACGSDPYSSAHSRIITCLPAVKNCVRFATYNDNFCQSFSNGISVVCGMCYKNNDANGNPTYSTATFRRPSVSRVSSTSLTVIRTARASLMKMCVAPSVF